MRELCFDLLRDWCDGLISLQIRKLGDPTIDGAFHCRACKVFHGRCPDAVYPLVYMYRETRDEKYLEAAKRFIEKHPDKILWCGEFGTIRHCNIKWRENWMRDMITILKEVKNESIHVLNENGVNLYTFENEVNKLKERYPNINDNNAGVPKID